MNIANKLRDKAMYIKKYADYFRSYPRSTEVDEVIGIMDNASNAYRIAAHYIIQILDEGGENIDHIIIDIENKADMIARTAYNKADVIENSFR